MKYLKYLLAILVIIISISAFSFEPKKHTKSAFLLDTYISVTAYGNNAKSAIEKAMDEIKRIDNSLSAFNEKSEIYKINTAKKDTPVKVSDECFMLLKRAILISQETHGAFDITIKPIVDLWGFGTDKQQVPDRDKLSKTLELVDYKNILLDSENKTVTKRFDDVKIDLGGIAKGYAGDVAAKVLHNEGVENAYLDLGGNVVTIGKMPQGIFGAIKSGSFRRAFTIGVQNPEKPRGEIFHKITANDEKCAVVTSGGYERFFYENGKKYHHILDTKTGSQPKNKVLSVTVVSKSSETADALSTAYFVLGPDNVEKNKELFEEVIFYMENGEVIKIKS